jgi:hypothetical protein
MHRNHMVHDLLINNSLPSAPPTPITLIVSFISVMYSSAHPSIDGDGEVGDEVLMVGAH